MFSRIISHLVGRGQSSHASPPRRRSAQRIAAASDQAIQSLESRVLLSTLYVDASAPGPNYDGVSWVTAYTDLQLALSASTAGDEIRIADGTYKPTNTTDRTISFALRDGVAIYGGYAGCGATDPDARNITLYPTILSGDIGTAESSADNSYHVVTATGAGASTIVDGVTVTAGSANGSGSNQRYGGGLFATGSSPTLIHCTFTGNSAGTGGGMYNTSSSAPALTYCTFSGNSVSGAGGGMHNRDSSSPALTNCTFIGNSANHGGGIYSAYSSSPTLTHCTFSGNSASSNGGGLYNHSFTSPTLTNCTFSGNSAISSGGAMYNSYSSPTLANCTFSGNSASGSFGSGGGMYNYISSPTLTNCSFSRNSASVSGGGMYSSISSSPTLTRCTFSGNSAFGTTGSGGGMYNESSSAALTNCTLSGNSASRGGGMYNYSSSPTLINCAFSGNSATGSSSHGGGMYNHNSSSPTLINCTFSGNSASGTSGYGGGIDNSYSAPTLINCIIWGNTAKTSPQIYQSGSTLTITYSDIQGGCAGIGNINAAPLFVRNPSAGPDGQWNGVDDDYGDVRLQPGSPCIDAGSNTAPGLAGITADLAGKPRFVDMALTPDTGAGTPPTVDMGAYEAQWACPTWLDPAGLAVWDANSYSLDIGSTTLVVAADDSNRTERLAAIRQFIASARGGGAGIVSSAAAEDQGVIATFDEDGNILVRPALIGDVTLDDRLDGDDYFALDRAFLAADGLQPAADLNVDGAIDGGDYLMLDVRFLRSAAGTIQQSAALPPVDQVAQQSAAPFSARSIADELLIEEDSALLTAR